MVAHRSPKAFDGRGVVLPMDDARPMPALFARYLALTHRSFLGLGPRLSPEVRAAHRQVVVVLTRAAQRDPRAVLRCFASPTVGAAIQCLPLRDALATLRGRIDAAATSMVAHMLFEMALRRLFAEGESVAWALPLPPLASLSLGAVIHAPTAASRVLFVSGALVAVDDEGTKTVLRLDPESLSAPVGFVVERPYFSVGQGTRLSLVDHNPIAAFETHPEKGGNAIDLGDRSVGEWTRVLAASAELVEAHLPELSAEMGWLLHEVIPVGYHAERHVSASYREAIGTVYMTLHPNQMTMTEALIHEFQHNKLNLASYSVDLLDNAFAPLYPSPIRPDPRPLWGILLAVHAFLPVAALYRRMLAAAHPLAENPDFAHRLSDIDLKNHEGMEMLRAHAVWTPEGRALMDELDALDRAHMGEREAKGLSVAPIEAHLG